MSGKISKEPMLRVCYEIMIALNLIGFGHVGNGGVNIEMKLAITVVASMFVLTHCPQANASELIGRVVPPFPVGISEGGGSCIGDDDATLCQRAFLILKTSAGRDFLIVSGSAEPPDGKKARWRIIDALAYPKYSRRYDFVSECRRSGTPDASIIAIVRVASWKNWLPAWRWAYRVENSTGKFVKLNPQNVDCANDGED